MFLYLVQHAEAKREEEDPSRPLSERGLRGHKQGSFLCFEVGYQDRQDIPQYKIKSKADCGNPIRIPQNRLRGYPKRMAYLLLTARIFGQNALKTSRGTSS